MPLEVLAEKLLEARSKRPEVAAIIRADGGRPYREVIEIMRTIRRAGIHEIKLATQPEH